MKLETKKVVENLVHTVTLIVTLKLTLLAPHKAKQLRFASKIRPLFKTIETILIQLSEESFADGVMSQKLQRVRLAIEKVKEVHRSRIYPQ